MTVDKVHTMIVKCKFYDKGFCRTKNECSQIHPSNDCDGNCDDKRKCPSRHRHLCKDGLTGIVYATKSCEFLHPDRPQLKKSH